MKSTSYDFFLKTYKELNWRGEPNEIQSDERRALAAAFGLFYSYGPKAYKLSAKLLNWAKERKGRR
jgi:hypothetical protein